MPYIDLRFHVDMISEDDCIIPEIVGISRLDTTVSPGNTYTLQTILSPSEFSSSEFMDGVYEALGGQTVKF